MPLIEAFLTAFMLAFRRCHHLQARVGHLTRKPARPPCLSRVPVSISALAYPRLFQSFRRQDPAPASTHEVPLCICTHIESYLLRQSMSMTSGMWFLQHTAGLLPGLTCCFMQVKREGKDVAPVTYMVRHAFRLHVSGDATTWQSAREADINLKRLACEWGVDTQGPEEKVAGHMLFLHLRHDCTLGQVRSCRRFAQYFFHIHRTWSDWQSPSRRWLMP